MTDPHAAFPWFYRNPAVRMLAKTPRWTISGRIGEDEPGRPATRKAPIDIRALLELGRLRGAWAKDEQCLVPLGVITQRLPSAANLAFYLQAAIDGLIVIDIESDCPPEIASSILALGDDEIVYREVSLSGRGYHLVAPIPPNFYDYPHAARKVVLREEHGWYEILIEHWATFTRTPIPPARLQVAAASPTPFASVAELYRSLAETATVSAGITGAAIDIDDRMPEIAHAEHLVEQSLRYARSRLKTLEDFAGDRSRWEFSTLSILYHALRSQILSVRTWPGVPEYTDSDAAWLVYRMAVQVLPHRAKHDESRNGRPFLLDRAASLIAIAQEELRSRKDTPAAHDRRRGRGGF